MALPKERTEWLVTKVEQDLDAILDLADAGKPQEILRGEKKFVISAENLPERSPQPLLSFEEFLLTAPKLDEDDHLELPSESPFGWRPLPFLDDELAAVDE